MLRHYMGMRSATCPDCAGTVRLPYLWGVPSCHQPRHIAYSRALMMIDHARKMPLLHPTLLPQHHAPAGRR